MPSFFIGLKYIPTTKATLIFNLSPVFVSIVAYFVLKEQLTKLKIFTVIGSFIGVVIFSYSKTSSSNEEADNYYIGIALVSIAVFGATGVSVLLRILNQNLHYAVIPFWFGITICLF